jgi:hypothetical protein
MTITMDNQSNGSHKVVLVAAMLVFGLGWFNANKAGKNPSARFLIGAGVTFTALSFLSDYSPPAANAFALAIATTAFFSEGTGILSYLNQNGEINTPTAAEEKASQATPHPGVVTTTSSDNVGQIPGI